MVFDRTISRVAAEMARTFRSVVVCGPRQVGKTWVLTKLTKELGGYETISFDDIELREQARSDPKLFLQLHPAPIFLDEVQCVPELFPAMKSILDRNQERGQYLMTGSQQFKMIKGAQESLAGRIGVLRLYGLSKAEIEGRKSKPFIPSLAPRDWAERKTWDVWAAYAAIVKGSYPECHARPDMDVRRYFQSYVETYIERDVKDMVNIANVGLFRRFIKVCAARTGQLLNYADLARDAGISTPTARTWLSLLEISGLIVILYPYYSNLIKRATKSPKLYFTDTGLCSHLLGINSAQAAIDSPLSGALLETYVVMEICKSHWNAGSDANFWFFRDADGHEVDLLIDYEGALHPIEVKRAASVRAADINRNMDVLRKSCDARLGLGAVVFIGSTLGALDSETALIPVGAL